MITTRSVSDVGVAVMCIVDLRELAEERIGFVDQAPRRRARQRRTQHPWQVPTPGGLALLFAGLLALGASRRSLQADGAQSTRLSASSGLVALALGEVAATKH
jgi:UDP-N-acetylmuramyl pentapeptide phosphotransferase/UDP-N-acetylglucosamine-1-phosphate transferase